MSTLHTCNKPAALPLCLETLAPGDALLLLEDGVQLLLETDFLAGHVPALYALGADLAARGISDKISHPVKAVDYREFVALCLAHDKVVNWI